MDNYSHNTLTDEDNPLTFAMREITITGVVIPEPATGLLCLLGFASLWRIYFNRRTY